MARLFLLFILFSAKVFAQSPVPLIQADSLVQLLQRDSSIVVLDTRSPQEYEAGHLENARFVNYTTFKLSDVRDISTETPIVVYCLSGGRSGRVAQQLVEAGYRDVKNLQGGIRSWEASGNEVKRE